MSGHAGELARQAGAVRTAHHANALDRALADYVHRYRDASFEVTGIHITPRGAEFTVRVAGAPLIARQPATQTE